MSSTREGLAAAVAASVTSIASARSRDGARSNHSSARGSGLRMRLPAVAKFALLVLVASACQRAITTPSVIRTSIASPAAASGHTRIAASDYDPSLFDESSAIVDNRWFPLVPGTRYVWKGRAFDDEGQRVARRVVFIVTDLTKVIDGVTGVVGWDRDFNDGSMEESELAFYAQDVDGNVWHLGELVEHWDSGELDGARAWFVDSPEGARPGIQMLADPVEGAHYSQGFAPPPWFWQDRARVSETGLRTCTPVGCFRRSIITEEFEPRFPGQVQLKYYSAGIGGTRVGWRGNDEEREVMVLTAYGQLSADELDRARARVLAQEQRAYAYARTAPAERRTDV